MRESEYLKELYANRFSEEKALKEKNKIWQVLCQHFFQKYIPNSNTARVADVAAGYCEFINNIEADEKYAVDLNPDTGKFANNDVKVVQGTAADLLLAVGNGSGEGYFDIVFMSNFLEHLENKEAVQSVVKQARELLKDGGRLLILQPNIKYVKGQYWDFFDHKIPLTESALLELGEMLQFKSKVCIKRFLPYTTKSGLPKGPLIIWLYLMLMPISGVFFGSQSFLVLEK